jgi:hypothetical protein
LHFSYLGCLRRITRILVRRDYIFPYWRVSSSNQHRLRCWKIYELIYKFFNKANEIEGRKSPAHSIAMLRNL